MSRRSSARVLGGRAAPSGVRSVSRRSAAFRRVGLKPRMPRRTRPALIRFTIRVRSPTRPSRSRFGAPGVLLLEGRDRGHAAVVRLAAQPAEEGALEQLGVEPVGLGPAVLAGDRDAGGVDDVRLDAARPQPAGQPEAVAAGLEGDRDARDRAPALAASSRQRCSSRSSASWSGSSFFSGCRARPGTIPATSQLDWLSSTTAISVLSCCSETRDLLRSFCRGMGHLRPVGSGADGASPRRRPIASAPRHGCRHRADRGRGADHQRCR